MNKPSGYDEAKASGEFTPVELGGHHLVIKEVIETKSKNGADMVVVKFDFAKNDKQAGYFAKAYEEDDREEKKWSMQATQYIMVNDYQDSSKTSKNFKTFTSCVEHSNKGFETKFGIDDWGKQFVGKKIGGVFGEQMDFYNDKVSKKRVLRWFVSDDKVDGADIPAISETKAYKERPKDTTASSNGFIDVPDGIDEELPFN